MSAGQLRHRVMVQNRVATQDATGEPSTTWTDEANATWANVRFLTGLTTIKAGADASTVRASIRMRYRPVNAGQRVTFGAYVFTISAVLPNERKSYLDLVCEVVNVQT